MLQGVKRYLDFKACIGCNRLNWHLLHTAFVLTYELGWRLCPISLPSSCGAGCNRVCGLLFLFFLCVFRHTKKTWPKVVAKTLTSWPRKGLLSTCPNHSQVSSDLCPLVMYCEARVVPARAFMHSASLARGRGPAAAFEWDQGTKL